METAHFLLDAKGVASCYDTAAGIGVHGRGADKTKKRKGLHPLWFVVILIAACFVVPKVLGLVLTAIKGGSKKVHEAHPVAASASPDAKQATGVAVSAAARFIPTSVASPANEPLQSTRVVPDRAVVLGKLVRGDGKRLKVILSDGRDLEADSDELEAVHQNRIKVSGEWLYFKRPAPSVSAVVGEVAKHVDLPDKVPELPPPPPPPESEWQEYSDGVSRLKSKQDFTFVPRGT
jgi:hypothetical protein